MAIVAAIAATAAVVGTTVSVISQRAAARRQRRLSEVRQRREQIQQIRQARRLRARAINVGAQTGAVGGSALQGATGSILSQLGANLTFLDVTTNLQLGINRALSRSQTFGALASFGSQVFGAAGGVGAFSPPPPEE